MSNFVKSFDREYLIAELGLPRNYIVRKVLSVTEAAIYYKVIFSDKDGIFYELRYWESIKEGREFLEGYEKVDCFRVFLNISLVAEYLTAEESLLRKEDWHYIQKYLDSMSWDTAKRIYEYLGDTFGDDRR